MRYSTIVGATVLLITSVTAATADPKATPTPIRHPSVEAGLRYLKLAEAALASGYHVYKDFGGHRQKAQDLTQQAIVETEKALQFSSH
jgi:hypothetical protein